VKGINKGINFASLVREAYFFLFFLSLFHPSYSPALRLLAYKGIDLRFEGLCTKIQDLISPNWSNLSDHQRVASTTRNNSSVIIQHLRAEVEG